MTSTGSSKASRVEESSFGALSSIWMGVLVVDDPLKKIVWNDGAYMVIASTITYLRLKGGSHNVARDSMSKKYKISQPGRDNSNGSIQGNI
jgi:hypothetical protein